MKKPLAIGRRHWKYLLLLNTPLWLVVAFKIISYTPTWIAESTLILPDTGSNLSADLGNLGSLTESNPSFSTTVNPLKLQETILHSDALLGKIWKTDTGVADKKELLELKKYRKLFDTSIAEQSTTLKLSVKSDDPGLAYQRITSWIETYQQRLNELRQEEGASQVAFSQNQLEQAQRKLTQLQRTLAEFQENSGLINTEEQTKGLVNTIGNLTTALSQVQAQAQANEDKVRTLSARLELTPDQAIRSLGLGANPDYQAVRSKLTEVETLLSEARGKFTDQEPRIQTLLAQREELRNQLQRYVDTAAISPEIDATVESGSEGRTALLQQLILAESEASALGQQANKLQSQIVQLNKSLESIPQDQARLLELQRQYELAEGVYQGLVAQVQKSNIDTFDAYPNVQVLDPPTVELQPSKRKLILLGAIIASTVSSVALIILLERRDPLLSPNDLKSNKFSIVTTIPRLRNPGNTWTQGTETEVELQRLASAISLQPTENRYLLITSALMGEGKTTITLGLASALVDLGFQVLIVDGDFQRAAISKLLGYSQAIDLAVKSVQIRPGLDLLPNLPQQHNIAEIVTQGKFKQSLATAQSSGNYDYILVDSAPVSQTSETTMMANIISNVLFVVRPGVSKSNPVNDSLELLTQHNAKVLALIVNTVETKSKSYVYR